MSRAIISIEAKSEKEANSLLDAHRRQAIRLGLTEERDRFVGYDGNEKIWRGYLWMHSLPLGAYRHGNKGN